MKKNTEKSFILIQPILLNPYIPQNNTRAEATKAKKKNIKKTTKYTKTTQKKKKIFVVVQCSTIKTYKNY